MLTGSYRSKSFKPKRDSSFSGPNSPDPPYCDSSIKRSQRPSAALKTDKSGWKCYQLILVIFHQKQQKNSQFFLNSKCEKLNQQQQKTKQPLNLLLPLLKKMILSVIIWKLMIFFSSFFLDEEKNRKSLTYTIFCTFV